MSINKILIPEIESLDKETVCFKVPAKSLEGKSFLVVPEGWEAVCIADGQLGKVLKRGKYKISSLKAKSHVFEVLFYPILSEFSFLWGTKEQMDFSDPILSLPVKMGANGKLVFLVKNIRNVYLKSNQSSKISVQEVKAEVAGPLIKFLQENIATMISQEKISFLEFEKDKDKFFKQMFANLSFFLQNEFGLKLSNFLVDGIIFDKHLFASLEKAAKKEKENQEQKQLQNIALQNNAMLENVENVEKLKQTSQHEIKGFEFEVKPSQANLNNDVKEKQQQQELEEDMLLL